MTGLGGGPCRPPSPGSCFGECAFRPELPGVTGSRELSTAAGLSCHLHGAFGHMKSHQATAQDMWSEQNGRRAPVLSVSSLSQAFVAGGPRVAEPPGPPSAAEVRQGLGPAALAAGSTTCLAHWTHRGWLQPLKGSFSFSSIKLYFSIRNLA